MYITPLPCARPKRARGALQFTPRRNAANAEDMRGFFVGVSLSVAFIAGALFGGLLEGRVVSTASAAPSTGRAWAYFCFEEANVDQVAYKANAAGARGWEMVSATTGGSGEAIWCFRTPR